MAFSLKADLSRAPAVKAPALMNASVIGNSSHVKSCADQYTSPQKSPSMVSLTQLAGGSQVQSSLSEHILIIVLLT